MILEDLCPNQIPRPGQRAARGGRTKAKAEPAHNQKRRKKKAAEYALACHVHFMVLQHTTLICGKWEVCSTFRRPTACTLLRGHSCAHSGMLLSGVLVQNARLHLRTLQKPLLAAMMIRRHLRTCLTNLIRRQRVQGEPGFLFAVPFIKVQHWQRCSVNLCQFAAFMLRQYQ